MEAAMKTVTPTELRANIYQLLDEVVKTGVPLEIKKGDKKLRIVPVDKCDKLERLSPRPEAIAGDPEDLVTIRWEYEVNLDLP
jgi:prevent-host-death family protein